MRPCYSRPVPQPIPELRQSVGKISAATIYACHLRKGLNRTAEGEQSRAEKRRGGSGHVTGHVHRGDRREAACNRQSSHECKRGYDTGVARVT